MWTLDYMRQQKGKTVSKVNIFCLRILEDGFSRGDILSEMFKTHKPKPVNMERQKAQKQ